MNAPFSLCSEFGAIGESGDTRGPLKLHATIHAHEYTTTTTRVSSHNDQPTSSKEGRIEIVAPQGIVPI
jgi:hypothetical protein